MGVLNETKHTPGPWAVVSRMYGDITIRNTSIKAIQTEPIAADCHGAIVARIDYITSREDSHQRAFANARLIAAAPDLWQALKCEQTACDHCATCEICDGGETYCSIGADLTARAINLRRQALAKVEGGQP